MDMTERQDILDIVRNKNLIEAEVSAIISSCVFSPPVISRGIQSLWCVTQGLQCLHGGE